MQEQRALGAGPTVRLGRFGDPDQNVILNLNDGRYQFEVKPSSLDPISGQQAGLGDEVRPLGRTTRPGIVGLFVSGGHLTLWCLGHLLDLGTSEVTVRRRWVAPFLREFAVWDGSVLQVRFRFLAPLSELRDWPMSGDVLSYIEGALRSTDSRYRFAEFWKARSLGLGCNDLEALAAFNRSLVSRRS